MAKATHKKPKSKNMALEQWTLPVFVYGSEYEERPEEGDENILYVNADTGSAEDLSDADMEEWKVDEYVAFTGHRPNRPPQS